MGLGSTCAFLQAPISRLPRIAPSRCAPMPVSRTAVTSFQPLGAIVRQEMLSTVSLKAHAREAPAVSSTGRRRSLLVKVNVLTHFADVVSMYGREPGME